MLVSFTLTALMAANLFTPHQSEEAAGRSGSSATLLDPFQRFLDRMEEGYAAPRLDAPAPLRDPGRASPAIIIGFGSTIHRQRDDAAGRRRAGLRRWRCSRARRSPRTSERRSEVERIMLKHPEIEKVSTEIGFETGGHLLHRLRHASVNAAS